MTTFATDTSPKSLGRQMQKAREMVEAQLWRLTAAVPALLMRMRPDPGELIAKAARREAARRAVDNLLR